MQHCSGKGGIENGGTILVRAEKQMKSAVEVAKRNSPPWHRESSPGLVERLQV